MNAVYHKAGDRGHADYGWLETYHTFSFADYYNPHSMNFGVLRVLNDDTVQGGMGFGRHSHSNMEIVSIPLSGALVHNDSMGNEGTIRKGEVQVMSAGTGIVHSEKNASKNETVRFLQIWVIPNKENVTPRYDQISVSDNAKHNDFQQIVSPNKDDEGVWVHQDAWFSLANFDKGVVKNYTVQKEGNGVYIFVIEGAAKIGAQILLNSRDGVGLSNLTSFELEALENSEILIMDVPLELPE